jgi:hypothetical protein
MEVFDRSLTLNTYQTPISLSRRVGPDHTQHRAISLLYFSETRFHSPHYQSMTPVTRNSRKATKKRDRELSYVESSNILNATHKRNKRQ